MLTLLITAFAGAPAGYTEIRAGNDCKIYKGPATATGVVPVYADCTWPEIAPAKLHAKLSSWEGHAAIFTTVASSKIVKTEGSRSLVRQVHELSGVSNREVEIWMEKVPSGTGFEYRWTSPGPLATVAQGNVPTAQQDGYWKVTDAEGGGSHVEYLLTYDPGGSVPGFLVRWFQGSGTEASTLDLRTAGQK